MESPYLLLEKILVFSPIERLKVHIWDSTFYNGVMRFLAPAACLQSSILTILASHSPPTPSLPSPPRSKISHLRTPVYSQAWDTPNCSILSPYPVAPPRSCWASKTAWTARSSWKRARRRSQSSHCPVSLHQPNIRSVPPASLANVRCHLKIRGLLWLWVGLTNALSWMDSRGLGLLTAQIWRIWSLSQSRTLLAPRRTYLTKMP